MDQVKQCDGMKYNRMHVPIQQKCLKTFKSQNNGFISLLNVWISKCIQMDITTIN